MYHSEMVDRWVCARPTERILKSMGSSLKIIFHHLFLRLVFSVYSCYVFLFFYELLSYCSLLYFVLEFFLACIERDSLCCNIFVSSQEVFTRHKFFSNSKLTYTSASSGYPHSREMTELNSEYLESATVST